MRGPLERYPGPVGLTHELATPLVAQDVRSHIW